jgi:hypothetical protein
MPGRDPSQAANCASRECQTLGTDVGAPDDLPSVRLVPDGNRGEARERGQRPYAADVGEMDCAVPASPVAGWTSDTAGSRSAMFGNKASRVCIGCRRARGAVGIDRDAREGFQLAGASNFWQDVASRMASVGVPAHGPSSASVRRLVSCLRRDTRSRRTYFEHPHD